MTLAAEDIDSSSELTKRVSRKVTLRLIPFMIVLYIMSYLDRINVSFVGLEMNGELGFSDAVFGFGAGIFFVGYFLFGVPSNLMVERLGARKWISVIMVIWGVISVAMALVQSELQFYITRFLLGVAEAGFFPGMILYLTHWYRQRERGLAVAAFMSAIPAAGVLGGIVASQILQMHGVLGISGWKWLFIITGAPSIFLGIIAFFYLTDKPAHAKWLSELERANLMNTLAADAEATPRVNATVSQALSNPRVWQFAFCYFCLALGMYGFQLWLPQIIAAFGHESASTTALLSVIPALFQGAGMLIIGWHSDKTGERRLHFTYCAVAAALALFAAGHIPNVYLSFLALCITAFCIWSTVGPFWALAGATLSAEAAAAGIGLINSVGNLGGFAGPYLIGVIKTSTSSFTLPLLVLAASLLCSAFACFFSKKSN
jgi:ACS family tartrate transporter-like MFS transporter